MPVLLSPDDMVNIAKRSEAAQRVVTAIAPDPAKLLNIDGLYAIINSAKDVILLLEHIKSAEFPTTAQTAAMDVRHSYQCTSPATCEYIARRKFQYMAVMLLREADQFNRLLLAGVYPLHARLVQYWEDGAINLVEDVAAGEAKL